MSRHQEIEREKEVFNISIVPSATYREHGLSGDSEVHAKLHMCVQNTI